MADEAKKAGTQEDVEVQEGKIWAVAGYLNVLCLLPLLLKKDNKFALHHSKQGLVLFIGEVVLILVNVLPILGQLICAIGMLVLGIYSIVGIIQALMGNYWEAPLIKDLAAKINI